MCYDICKILSIVRRRVLRIFEGGVHPKDCKKMSRRKTIKHGPNPDTIFIPLQQHIGKPAIPVVAVSDEILRGQLLAKADGDFSANIFSSVSGTVKAIEKRMTASGKKTPHIKIEVNTLAAESLLLPPLGTFTPKEIRQRVFDAGIVGMGGAGFPTAMKLNTNGKAKTLLINAAECEPFITCDEHILTLHTAEFLKGVEFANIAAETEKVIIGIEDNKYDAIQILKQAIIEQNLQEKVFVSVLKTMYPQGSEKQLILSCTGKKVPEGKLPLEIGIVVLNVHTVYSIYRAVELNIPCYERIMTVSGKAVPSPRNYWIKNGTTFKDIAEFVEADTNCTQMIDGGPMMGKGVFSLDIACTKTSSSLLFLGEKELNSPKTPEPCIGCGKCVQACPIGLTPVYIEAGLMRNDLKCSKHFGASYCIECGCCSFVCPAKRHLANSVKLAKKLIKERNV